MDHAGGGATVAVVFGGVACEAVEVGVAEFVGFGRGADVGMARVVDFEFLAEEDDTLRPCPTKDGVDDIFVSITHSPSSFPHRSKPQFNTPPLSLVCH